MAASTRRAVLTGIGVITPIGVNADVLEAPLAGRSGIRPIQAFDAGLPVRFAGEIPDFDAKNYVEKSQRKGLRMMARTIQLAVGAAQLALNDAGVDKSKLVPERFGVEFGAGLIATELPELADASRISANGRANRIDLEKWGAEGLPAIQPLWMLKYLPNMLACHVSILHNAQGPNNSVTESDAASLLALGEAYRILVRDQADFFLVGGAESKINPLSMVRQCLFEPLSRCNDAPEKACRPFDRRRDGVVLGEGAGVFVLEELEHAKKRGARIYAEMVGFGAAFDRKLDGSGLARAISAALKDAGIGPEDVDHVNAHGLGSRDADVWEARGLQRSSAPPARRCSRPRATSATSAPAAARRSWRPACWPCTTARCRRRSTTRKPDPACPIGCRAGPMKRPHVLKVGFTRLGQCAAMVVAEGD